MFGIETLGYKHKISEFTDLKQDINEALKEVDEKLNTCNSNLEEFRKQVESKFIVGSISYRQLEGSLHEAFHEKSTNVIKKEILDAMEDLKNACADIEAVIPQIDSVIEANQNKINELESEQ